jgi:hypothetical protein
VMPSAKDVAEVQIILHGEDGKDHY